MFIVPVTFPMTPHLEALSPGGISTTPGCDEVHLPVRFCKAKREQKTWLSSSHEMPAGFMDIPVVLDWLKRAHPCMAGKLHDI